MLRFCSAKVFAPSTPPLFLFFFFSFKESPKVERFILYRKDSFSISCETYLGRLTKIRIGHDNSGFGAAWFLDKVSCCQEKMSLFFSCCCSFFSIFVRGWEARNNVANNEKLNLMLMMIMGYSKRGEVS